MNRSEQVLGEVCARLSLREPLAQALRTIAQVVGWLSLSKPLAEEAENGVFLSEQLEAVCGVAPQLRAFGRRFPFFTCSIATGIGKTRLMATAVYYLHQVHGVRHFFHIGPQPDPLP